MAVVDYAVIDEIFAVFFDEDFDTAGNGDGDDSANEAEGVNSNGDGG